MMNEYFFEEIKKTGHKIAEIQCLRQCYRRWIVIRVTRRNRWNNMPCRVFDVDAIGPCYWQIEVFDFDHVTYNLHDEKYMYDYDTAFDKREMFYELKTTDQEEFEREVMKFVTDWKVLGNLKRYPDFPGY
jgi:hypothetical protein